MSLYECLRKHIGLLWHEGGIWFASVCWSFYQVCFSKDILVIYVCYFESLFLSTPLETWLPKSEVFIVNHNLKKYIYIDRYTFMFSWFSYLCLNWKSLYIVITDYRMCSYPTNPTNLIIMKHLPLLSYLLIIKRKFFVITSIL